jgi:Bifunctional DNA primase/polymerase, N-terminal
MDNVSCIACMESICEEAQCAAVRRQVHGVNRPLEAALGYRQLGWSLLPVGTDKRPYFDLLAKMYGSPGWDGLRTRAASEVEIEEWFRLDPNTGVGIITGAASGGLVVVDFDHRRPRRLIDTPLVETGRGLHVYLCSSSPIESSRHDGFEVKADGSYVVAPPSAHPSGHRYEWLLAPTGLGNLFLPEAEPAEFANLALEIEPSLPSSGVEKAGNLGVNLYFSAQETEPVDHPGDLRAWDGNDDFVLRVVRLLRIPEVPLGSTFLCILPGHRETHPSASLYREPQHGTIVYRDWHHDNRVYTLAEVYAARVTGQIRPLQSLEYAVWKLRLLIETGLLKPAQVDLPPLPPDAPPHVHTYWDGYRLLLACRWITKPGEPVTYTRQFAVRWCGLTASQAERAKQWLIEHGLLISAGKTGRIGLWLPAGTRESATRRAASLNEDLLGRLGQLGVAAA